MVVAVFALASCEVEGETKPAASRGSDDRASACAGGDAGAGEGLVAELREQRLAGASFADHQAELAAACEAGCAAACLEHARNEPTAEAQARNRQACELGAQSGCDLAGDLKADIATSLCEGGEVLACAALQRAALREGGELEAGRGALLAAAEAGCEAKDGRSCSLAAWTRCAGLGQCDAAAIASADKAAKLTPLAPILETRALVQCHAGEAEAADASLASACAEGHELACDRACEQIGERRLLLHGSARSDYQRLLALLELQNEAPPAWLVVISAMSPEELAKFTTVLEVFTPPITEAGAKVEIPEQLRADYPTLVEAILRSPQLEAKKIKYWFGRLPDMDEEQRANLFESLRKQWWVIPAEGSQTPQGFIDELRLKKGGHQL